MVPQHNKLIWTVQEMSIRIFTSCKLKFCVISGFFVIQIAWFPINCFKCFAVTKSKQIHRIEKRSLQIWRFRVETTKLTMVQLMAISFFYFAHISIERKVIHEWYNVSWIMVMLIGLFIDIPSEIWQCQNFIISSLSSIALPKIDLQQRLIAFVQFPPYRSSNLLNHCMQWDSSKLEVCRNVNVINSIAFVQSWK